MRALVALLVVAVLGCGSGAQAPDRQDAGSALDAGSPPDAGCVAQPERCDGKDNDCDGLIDEDFDLGKPCSVGVGACRAEGVTVCSADGAGTTCNAQARSPSEERCNGIDDNCDGQIDEGFGIGTPCEVGVGACLRGGALICDGEGGVRCNVEPGTPSAEVCNGVDDDCNGAVDDVVGLGDDCTASAPGICAQGHLMCGSNGMACAPGTPQPETCNGLDDNCDGVVDEGFGVGVLCTVGLGTCQRTGVKVCDGTAATRCSATPGTPAPEQCNGIDDDCNGIIDDVAGIGGSCTAAALGICAQGQLQCGPSSLVCTPGDPRPEACNGLDNDCDGFIDENDPNVGLSCTTGEPGVCSPGAFICAMGGRLLCQPTIGPSAELCNGLDDDCNGIVDDACLPFPTKARSPANGVRTGSPWTPAGVAATPLRPTFRWEPVMGADHYEIEVDDSCSLSSFRDCAFPSPEIQVAVADTSFQPPAPLTVAMTPPVGRRYFWRVRACNGAQCSPYTEVRYLDVGRVPGDVNGDGYPDLLVGFAPDAQAAGVLIYPGGPSGVPGTPTVTLSSPPFFGGTAITVHDVGDLNGDGFDDVCVGSPEVDSGNGAAFIYYGGPAGPPNQPSIVLDQVALSFGRACFGAGDVNGDGYADLVVGGASPAVAVLYAGSAAGIATAPTLQLNAPQVPPSVANLFAATGAGLGDIDGDGYADFAIGAVDVSDINRSIPGAVFVYRGGPLGPSVNPSQTIHNSVDPGRPFFGAVIEGDRDIDGDGLSDVFVASEIIAPTATPIPNSIYVYFGSSNGLIDPPLETIPSPRLSSESFATVIALGDANGDGYVDLLDSDVTFNNASPGTTGIADLFVGMAGGLGTSPRLAMLNPEGQENDGFGAGVAMCDLNADGYDERIIMTSGLAFPNTSAAGTVVYVYAGSPMPSAVPSQTLMDTDPIPGNDLLEGVSCGR